MSRVFIGLGSNIGDREKNIRDAVSLISEKFRFVALSSIYETEPMYNMNQPAFLNAVVSVETKHLPLDVLRVLLDIELRLGRVRTVKNGPRTIDLDILFYDDLAIDLPDLKIPHPFMHERAFVMVPLAEIAPNVVHPSLKKKISTLSEMHSHVPVRILGDYQ